ncbi:MAG TPA: KH domain-containing protein [Patescibacteria group bacterium]|nr:KH domain-containing protein [Patescibacteria group bacterium]
MKKLLKYLVEEIIGITDFTIKENEENSFKTYELLVPSEYVGLIIGKNGKTIKTLRNLMKVRAILDKVRFNLVVTSSN